LLARCPKGLKWDIEVQLPNLSELALADGEDASCRSFADVVTFEASK
jgi:hypothetical protein